MQNTKIQSYKDLVVWQKSVDLVVEVYKLTAQFPQEEKFGLTSQMTRAAVSIPSNIAEGRARSTRKDFANFIGISYASAAELETQVIIAKRLSFSKDLTYNVVDALLEQILKMLGTMRIKLRSLPASSSNL